MEIRPERAEDHSAIREANRLAFGRDDEGRLVDALRAGGYARVSVVAEAGGVSSVTSCSASCQS
jgi:predicted N-acetyltransferase YhbS